MSDDDNTTEPVDPVTLERQELRNVSHGLLNDLCVVLANAQCSLSGETDPEKREDLTSIITAARRAEQRIQALRKLYQ
jgi:hypothetical protein